MAATAASDTMHLRTAFFMGVAPSEILVRNNLT
jgi:hypothetical protein